MNKHGLAAIWIALFVAVAVPSAAMAHAFPDHALPAVGATVAAAPAEVRIWFTEKLEPSFSKIEVLDPKGVRVDQDDSMVDPQDASVLHVSLRPLLPGTYKVVWRVVSVDTHATQGDFSFTVGK